MSNIKFIGTNQVELVNSLSGTTISPASSGENFIEFSFNTLSKDNKDYYHFVITGSNVQVSGTINSVTTKHQFVNLFKDQTAITTASGLQLTAPTMKEFCYSNMFLNCTSLKTPPSTLPAQNLDAWCYAGMFAGCTALTSAPTLPAAELAKYCYYAMFYNCKALLTAPTLPAYKLKEFCYNSMFYGCGCLGANGSRCVINGFNLVEGSCANMFVDCKNLGRIEIYAGQWDTTPNTSAHCNATNIWTHDLPTTGFFGKIKELTIERGESRIPQNWEVGEDAPLIFKSTGFTHVQLNKVGSPNENEFIVCRNSSSDTFGAISSYSPGDIITLHDGEFVSFRGIQPRLSVDSSNYYHFDTWGTGTLTLSGKFSSLTRSSTSTNNVYRGLFSGCTNIVDASGLRVSNTTLGANAYAYMFYNCTGLSAIPILSSRNLSNSCYYGMYQNCTGLSSINTNVLPASGLANNCYKYMFSGCKNLKTVPVTLLPATTLAPYCYQQMFENCSSLLYTPTLTASTLAEWCYYGMFEGCKSVSAFNVGFTSWNVNGSTGNWAMDVKNTGIFIKPYNLPTSRDISAIPYNWAVLVKSGAWLVYSEPYGNHAVGDHYTGGNPYGYS